MEEKATHTETIEVAGEDLVAKVKEIVHEGNVRRIIIKNEDGEKVIEIPLLPNYLFVHTANEHFGQIINTPGHDEADGNN